MRRQYVNKIACVNGSLALVRFTARAKNDPAAIKSQPSENLLTGQYAVIDLTNVQGAVRNATEFEILVEQEPFETASVRSGATVTFSPPNRDNATFVATYVVTGLAGSLQVSLLE
jgi:hypothetical protein